MSSGGELSGSGALALHEAEAGREAVATPWRTRAAATLLVVGAFAVVLAIQDSRAFDLDRYLVPKALALHATALALLALGFPTRLAARWGAVEWLLAAFVLSGAMSAALASNAWLALAAWGIGLSSLVLFLAAREVARTLRWPVLAGLIAAAVLGAGLGIAQAYGAGWGWLANSRPPGGTFGNRNFLGHLSVLAAAPLVVMILRTRRPAWLLPALVGLAALATAVVLTRSRAAWLGGMAGVTVATLALLLARRGPRPSGGRAAAAAAVLAGAVVVAVLVPNQLRWTADSPYVHTLARLTEFGEGSGRGRLIQYRHSLDLVREEPLLGVGPGNWFVHYPRVTQPGDPAFAAHLSIPTNPWPSSDWVAFLTERGVLGLLFLAAAGAAAALRALGRLRGGSREEAYMAAALLGLLTTALVAGSFDAVLLLAAPSYLVWTAAALLLPEPRPSPAGTAAARGRAGLRAILVVLVLLLVADAGSRSAAIALTAGGDDRQTLARAARLSPGEYRLHMLLAERGDCQAARRTLALMPHHPSVRKLVEGCAD